MLRISILISAILTLAQFQAQQSVQIDMQDSPLSAILQEIKAQSEVRMAYDARNLREIKTSFVYQGSSVEEALDSLLQGHPYEPLYLKNTWLIVPKEVRPNVTPEGGQRRNFPVSGRLIDANTGEALPYANISLKGVSGGTVSNLDGYFSLSSVRIDSIPMCFSYVGYHTRCIDLREHGTENMLIKLKPANTYLLAVDVIGEELSEIEVNPAEDLMKLDARSFTRRSSTPHSDVFQNIQQLPGVSSGDGLDAQLHIRGGEEDENLILWDGFTLYHLDHFFGVFSTFNPHVIKDISLRKGPYSSRFGGRSGGVLEVTGKSGNRTRPHTRFHTDLIDAGILTEGPVGKHSSYLVSFRRSHTDVLSTGFYDELLERLFAQSTISDSEALVQEEVESNFYYYDINFKWHSDLGPRDGVDLSLFSGGDRFQRDARYTYEPQGSPFQYNDLFDDRSHWGNLGLGLKWSHKRRTPGAHARTSLGLSEYDTEYYFLDRQEDYFNGIPLPEQARSQLRSGQVKDLTLSHIEQRKMKDKGSLEFGYQFTRLDVKEGFTIRNFSSNSVRLADSTEQSTLHAVFLDRTWHFESGWRVKTGARATVNSLSSSLYLEPRIRVSYPLLENVDAHIATGKYVQPIRRTAEQNLFLRQPDRWVLSDGQDLPESESWHTALGLDWNTDKFELSAEAYYKQLKGVILNQEQNRLLSAFTAESEGLAIGDGEVYGLDLLLTIQHRAHHAWLAYSYAHAANSFKEVNEGRPVPSTFNKPHDFKLNYAYRYRDYSVHSQLMASSGYPYTPILGFFEGPGGDVFLIYGEDLSARLPFIFRWDISINRTFSFNEQDLTLGVGVYNLTDHKNIKNRTYTVDEIRGEPSEELNIKAVDLELIGLSPTFSLSLDIR